MADFLKTEREIHRAINLLDEHGYSVFRDGAKIDTNETLRRQRERMAKHVELQRRLQAAQET